MIKNNMNTETIRPGAPLTISKSKCFLSLCFLGFILTLGMQVYVSNKYAVKGVQMQELLSRQEELEKAVFNLDLKISQVSSLSKIETRAKQLGFTVLSSEVVYLSDPVVASNLR